MKYFTVAFLLLVVAMSSSAQQFPCDGKLYFFRYSNGQDQLAYIDGYTTATPVVVDVCPIVNLPAHNALGANPVDHLIYFKADPSNLLTTTVYRIDANCNITIVCSNMLPITNKGCFDNWGRYWIIDNTNKLRAYNLNTCSLVKGPYQLSAMGAVDFIFSDVDCHFYIPTNNNVFQLDTNGVITATFTPGFNAPAATAPFGGCAMGSDGNIYGLPNSSAASPAGLLYQYNLSTMAPGGLIFNFPQGTSHGSGQDMASFRCDTLNCAFMTAPDSGCAPLTVQFNNITTGPMSSFSWDFGDATQDTINNNPSHTFTSPGTYTVTLIVNANSNCRIVAPDTFTTTVNVFPPPVVSFGGDTTICLGDTTTITAAGGISYLWSTLDTTSSIIVSPVLSTTYIVTVTNANGCTTTDSVTVHVDSLPVITVTPDVTICNGDSVSLTANGASTYSWSPSTDLNSSTGSTVVSHTTSQITYTVTGDLNGCTATNSVTVSVNPTPVVTVTPNISICSGDSATLTAGGANTYSWSPATYLNASTGSSVISHASSQVTYTVTGDVNACTASAQVTVSVNALPIVMFTPNPISECAPLFVQFNDVSVAPSGSSYLWDFGDSTTSALQNPGHMFISPGQYTITFTITSPGGCIGSFSTQAVTVYPNPTAVFTASPQISDVGNPISFTDHSYANIVSWDWNFGDGVGTSNVQNPIYTYSATGTETVELIVSNTFGCLDTAQSTVIIESRFEIWIPNTFTPNGDKINEIFNPVGVGIKRYDLSIFDRWGIEVFRSTEKDQGWNGKMQGNDVECMIGTYVYVITAWDNKNVAHKFTGSVSLVR